MPRTEKAELAASVHHTERFSKSKIGIYNSKFLDTAGRKTRRTQAIAKCNSFYTNAIIKE